VAAPRRSSVGERRATPRVTRVYRSRPDHVACRPTCGRPVTAGAGTAATRTRFRRSPTATGSSSWACLAAARGVETLAGAPDRERAARRPAMPWWRGSLRRP